MEGQPESPLAARSAIIGRNKSQFVGAYVISRVRTTRLFYWAGHLKPKKERLPWNEAQVLGSYVINQMHTTRLAALA